MAAMARVLTSSLIGCAFFLAVQCQLDLDTSKNNLPRSDLPSSHIGGVGPQKFQEEGHPITFSSELAISRRSGTQPHELKHKMKIPMPAPSIKDICDRFDVNGCSVPFGLPFFDKSLFTTSCDRHDICYHCGVAFGFTRLDCDYEFRHNTRKACRFSDGQFKEWDGVRSGRRSQKQTRLHRRVVQELIDTNALVLDILEEELNETKTKVSRGKILMNQQFLVSMQRRVLLKWTLLLSSLIKNDHENSLRRLFRNNTREDKTKDNHASNPYLDLDLAVSRSTWLRQNDLLLLSKAYDMEWVSAQQSFTRKTCEKVLHEADMISIYLQHQYRVSDIIDCEDIRLLSCYFFSNIYFWAVRLFGTSSYHQTPEIYCHGAFVQFCLPKS